LAGVWVGWVIAGGGNLFSGTASAIQSLIDVFTDPGQTRVVIFTLLMGALLLLLQRGGGVAGFLAWVGRWRWSGTRRGAQLLAACLGLGVFIESTITCLVVGAVARPIFDRLRMSREKLAYICDATSAPVCMLIPINSWGAVILGLLATQASLGTLGDRGALTVFLAAVPPNFYAILSVLLVFVVAATGWDAGPMRRAERRAAVEGKLVADGARPVVTDTVLLDGADGEAPPRARHLVVPLTSMIAMVLVGIAVTGVRGADAAGVAAPTMMDYLDSASGSTAVLWGVLAALAVLSLSLTAAGVLKARDLVDVSFRGAGAMLPIATLLVLAFGIGAVCDELGTGPYIAAQVTPFLTPLLVAPLVFLVSGAIAFATGTSWGTFAIMIPLALPLAASMNLEGAAVSLSLVVSAVLGGGVFGDHCSPIIDTTLIASMAAWSDHIDHVRTQLPYALAAAGGAVVLYLVAGLLAMG
jgi:Na+/H+ antiporter NhaC